MSDQSGLKNRMDRFLDGFDDSITMHTAQDAGTSSSVDRIARSAHVVAQQRSPLLGPHAECDPSLLSDRAQQHLADFQRDGFAFMPDMVQGEQLRVLQQETARVFDATPFGTNSFGGEKTKRFYAALAKTRALDQTLANPLLAEMVGALFFPNALLSALQMISIHPGEKQQKLHFDQAFSAVRPSRGTGTFIVNFLLAIDDFTPENGATVILPGSHVWPADRLPTPSDRRIPATMKAGTVMAFSGLLWHAGGANRSRKERRCALMIFQEPWLRPLENHFLSIPFQRVMELPPLVQSYLGYSLCHPFIGQVDFAHPVHRLKELAAKTCSVCQSVRACSCELKAKL